MTHSKNEIHVLHPGNRGIHWCDIESSRNFVRDDNSNNLTFSKYIDRLLLFPLSFFIGKKIIMPVKYKIIKNGKIQIAIFPDIPGWIAVSENLKEILVLFSNGCTFNEINKIFYFHESHLHLLLVSLFIKGCLLINNSKYTSEVKYKKLYLADELALVEITRNCNIECTHCFNFSGQALTNELNFDQICNLIDKITDNLKNTTKNKTVTLSGGEPFVRKDIFKIIEYINTNGYCVEILTNGTAMPTHFLEKLSKLDIKVRVSLDGSTKEIHEKIRGANTFDKTVRNIKSLLNSGINTGVTTSITKYNYHELKKMVKFLNKLKVDFFQFIITNQLGRAVDTEVVNYKIAKIYNDLFYLAKDHGEFYESMRDSTLANIIACNVAGLYFYHCGVGIQKDFYVQSNGDLFPCRATILPEYKIGNVKSDEIPSFNQLSSSILDNLSKHSIENLNTECSNCSVRYWCAGDCRGETYQSTGSLRAKAPHCEKIMNGIETSLFLTAENPDMYFEKSNSFYNRTNRIDSITQALEKYF